MNRGANFAEEIEVAAAACGEEIINIRISPTRSYYADDACDGDPDDRHSHSRIEPRVYSWVEARPLLSYAYDDGFGSQDCHSIYAWTNSWVLFVHEYDGSTSIARLPRHPTTPVERVVADGLGG